MSKPREYWIVEELERYPKYPNDAYEEKPISGDFIHVIEYSAYVELLAKLEAAEKEWSQDKWALSDANATVSGYERAAKIASETIAKERAINAVLVEALDKVIDCRSKRRAEEIAFKALTKAKDMRDE